MKSYAVRVVCLVMVIGSRHPACSGAPAALNHMTCQVTAPKTAGCTGIPTLRSGLLTMSKDGMFELQDFD